jgi:hypothetical protein
MRRPRGNNILLPAVALFLLVGCIGGMFAVDRCWKGMFHVASATYPGTLTGPTLREDEALAVARRLLATTPYAAAILSSQYGATTTAATRAAATTPTARESGGDMSRAPSEPNFGTFTFYFVRPDGGVETLFVYVEKRGDTAEVSISRGT